MYVEYPEDGDVLTIAMEQPYEHDPARFGRTCPTHGRLDLVDDGLDPDLTVERNGVEYRPKPDAVIAVCPECFDDRRRRSFDYRDLDDRALLEELLTSRAWREFKTLFEPIVDEDRTLQFCPYCGEDLATADDETGRVTCPDHGPISIKRLRRA